MKTRVQLHPILLKRSRELESIELDEETKTAIAEHVTYLRRHRDIEEIPLEFKQVLLRDNEFQSNDFEEVQNEKTIETNEESPVPAVRLLHHRRHSSDPLDLRLATMSAEELDRPPVGDEQELAVQRESGVHRAVRLSKMYDYSSTSSNSSLIDDNHVTLGPTVNRDHHDQEQDDLPPRGNSGEYSERNVTRISVRSNGDARVTHNFERVLAAAQVALQDGDRVTDDDETSERLI
jgi:hypothetical protein